MCNLANLLKNEIKKYYNLSVFMPLFLRVAKYLLIKEKVFFILPLLLILELSVFLEITS